MLKLIIPLSIAALGLCSMVNSSPANTTKIIGHRGASYEAPENTLASFRLAWQKKADAIELDIHMSKDGKLMVSHDGSTGRMTGKDLVIKDSTAEELRALDAGSIKGKQYAGERIPYLEEVLKELPRGCGAFIEIKCGKEALPALQKAIKDSRKERQISIIGFDLDTISAFKVLMPKIPVFWLQSKGNAANYSPQFIESVKQHGIDGLDLLYDGVNKEYVDAIRAAGLKIYTWTVDDPTEAKRLADLKVDGITTNRPDFIREQISKK